MTSSSIRDGDSTSFMIPYEDLTISERIGGGATATVHQGYWKKCPVAIKKWFDPKCEKLVSELFNSEILALRNLRHPNIVQFLGACAQPPNLCLVMEHLPISLHSLLYQSTTDLNQQRIVRFGMDICRAMIYLHDQKPCVIHRDLKPSNFLVDKAWKVKLCDFGLASNLKSQRTAGTIAYMASELLESEDTPFNEKVDIYAFGVVLNEMLTRKPPFLGLSPSQIKDRVMKEERPEISLSTPQNLNRLVQQCWHHCAGQRPSFVEIHDCFERMLC